MTNKSTNGEWEKVLGKFEIKIEDGFFSGCTVYHSAVYEFIKDKLSQAEEKGYQRGYKEGVDDTLDEYGDGPSS